MPLPDLVRAMDPPAPDEVRAAADALAFRDFLTVALVVPDDAAFPDNWIYVHSPGGAARAHPELRGVVAGHGQAGPHLPGPGVLRVRGRRAVGAARRRAGRAGPPRAGRARARGPGARSRPGTWCGCRRRTRSTTRASRRTSRCCAVAGRRTPRNVVPGGPQRHAPLQQPGPLDAHRDAGGGEHPRAWASTTCGRSTSRATTTRRSAEISGAPAGTGRSAPVCPIDPAPIDRPRPAAAPASPPAAGRPRR